MILRKLFDEAIQAINNTPYSDEQIKHLAITFRLFGFAILGALGWPSFTALSMLGILITIIAFVFFQFIAFMFLQDVE